MEKPKFEGGINIALKIPKADFEKTIKFYKDILGFELIEERNENISRSFFCQFGKNRLWFDMVENYSQKDVWLELKTDNMEAARNYLHANGISFRDELEKLPEDLDANWISDPAGVVLLLNK